MPEWLAPLLVSAALAVVGWVVRRGFESLHAAIKDLRDEFKAIADKQAKLDKDCVTWADHEALKLNVNGIDRRVTVLETTCKQEHGK